jgi:hypothetical protein
MRLFAHNPILGSHGMVSKKNGPLRKHLIYLTIRYIWIYIYIFGMFISWLSAFFTTQFWPLPSLLRGASAAHPAVDALEPRWMQSTCHWCVKNTAKYVLWCVMYVYIYIISIALYVMLYDCIFYIFYIFYILVYVIYVGDIKLMYSQD